MAQLLKAIVDTQKNNYKAIGQVNAYDSLELELEIKMNGVNVELVNPSFELISKKVDGNRVRQLKDISYADRKIKIIADEQITACSKSGIVSNQLIIKDEGRMSTCLFYFLLGSSLDREIIQSIDKVEVLEQLDEYVATAFANLDEFEKRIITGEATIRKLNDDMTAAESNRENAESNRGNTFDDLVLRMDNAIRAAISTDETLNNNEVARINNYNILKSDLEGIREELISLNNSVDLEEQKRVQAEIDRTNANIEAINKLNSTNESVKKAEALRGKEWETIKDENTRLKEALTTINNTANSNEEVRKTNESARVTAEQNRVTEFNKIKEDNKVLETNLVKKVDDKIVEIEAQNIQFKDKVTADYNAFTADVDGQILKSKTDYFGKEHTSVDERLNEDFDNIHQRVNNSEYLPYEGSNITAENSYYGLTKEMSIKGRTLQNLLTSVNYIFEQAGGNPNVDYIEVRERSSLVVTRLTEAPLKYAYFKTGDINTKRFKPNTKYTVIFGKCENLGAVALQTGDTTTNIAKMTPIQNKRAVITTVEDLSIAEGKIITVYVTPKSYMTNTRFAMGNILILEGDHTNTAIEELPYGEGIYSVGEKEVTPEGKYPVKTKSCGKNLLDISKSYRHSAEPVVNGNELLVTNNKTGISWASARIPVRLKPNTNYKIKFQAEITTSTGYPLVNVRRADDGNTKIGGDISPNVEGNLRTLADTSDYVVSAYATGGITNTETETVRYYELQIEEVPSLTNGTTTYEPYQGSILETFIDEPLRGLPNGIADEILGNKLTRRVGAAIFNGMEPGWAKDTTKIGDTLLFYIPSWSKSNNCKADSALICNKFHKGKGTLIDEESIILGANNVNIRILSSKLSSPDVTGFTAWLKENPIIVYYELDTPVSTELDGELTLKTFDTTTHITSNNYLLPKLSVKVPSNVQAVVSGLRTENEALKTDLKFMNLVTEENNIKNIETNLDQEARLTMIEMGVI